MLFQIFACNIFPVLLSAFFIFYYVNTFYQICAQTNILTKMCCKQSLQYQTHAIAIYTITSSILMIIIGQFTLLLCPNDINCEPGNDTLHLLNSQKGKIYCHISLGKQYQYYHGTLTVIVMMFMLLVEIPTSIFLLMGARLRLRYNLIPWLVVTAFKMIFWVVLTCLVVWWAFKGMLHTMNILSADTMLDQTNKTLLQHYYLQYLGQNVSETLKIGDGPSKGWYVKLCTITVLYVNSK